MPPGFAILDEHERDALLAEATDEMLTEATAERGSRRSAGRCDRPSPTPPRASSTSCWPRPCASATGSRQPCASMTTRRTVSPSAEAIYRAALGLDARRQPGGRLRAARCELLLRGRADARCAMCSAPAAPTDVQERRARSPPRSRRAVPARRIEALARCFLTGTGEPRKIAADQDAGGRAPAMPGAAARRARRSGSLPCTPSGCKLAAARRDRWRCCGSATPSCSATPTAKARRAALDFDDLVARAASLLGSSAAVEWVLYKLDGGLDHILVDEAQDTSPVQWQVIRALAEEFFSGSGAREVARTLFAVGDEKQSIYSFQGAAPAHVRRHRRGVRAAAPQRAGLPWRARAAELVVPLGRAAAGGGGPHLRRSPRGRRA